MEPTPVVYAGSFDPVTKGHLDIALRARDAFGAVILLVIANGNKKPLFSTEERVALLQQVFAGQKNIRIEAAAGLLTDYLKKNRLQVVVRGLRGASDLDHEMTNAYYNKLFAPTVETVWLPAKPEYTFISSSAVREAASYGGDVSSLVPPCVADALKKKFLK